MPLHLFASQARRALRGSSELPIELRELCGVARIEARRPDERVANAVEPICDCFVLLATESAQVASVCMTGAAEETAQVDPELVVVGCGQHQLQDGREVILDRLLRHVREVLHVEAWTEGRPIDVGTRAPEEMLDDVRCIDAWWRELCLVFRYRCICERFVDAVFHACSCHAGRLSGRHTPGVSVWESRLLKPGKKRSPPDLPWVG